MTGGLNLNRGDASSETGTDKTGNGDLGLVQQFLNCGSQHDFWWDAGLPRPGCCKVKLHCITTHSLETRSNVANDAVYTTCMWK